LLLEAETWSALLRQTTDIKAVDNALSMVLLNELYARIPHLAYREMPDEMYLKRIQKKEVEIKLRAKLLLIKKD
jgi:hypothetical protein